MMKSRCIVVCLLLLSASVTAIASKIDNRSRLYTKPDPSASGGIRGHIRSPNSPIEQILALPSDEPRHVYEGIVTGDDRRNFVFKNLPMRKYDLIVIYRNRFYEGIRLRKGESTLTTQDREKINKTIQKSERFFDYKKIHRLEGETGRGNLARAIVTYFSAKKTITYVVASSAPKGREYRRTIKLVLLKDVGPGWQITRTRDLYPKSIPPEEGKPAHKYSKALSQVRVTDHTKDLGEIDLSKSDR